ncbi:hypothetical protein [Embleya scabrispora]|uniref:hypothetical protein n=1 Tax=Embleya scabrispora TaxID=159449 RepID=UPI00036BF9F8|nr:hypothetical protein [Embleya scabrispora]MYS80996.1 hypothetical protein [Streptomyces sp. SID5474]
MKRDISLDWVGNPAAEERRATEVYASVTLPAPTSPSQTPSIAASADADTGVGIGSAADTSGDRIGTVTARRAGRMLGRLSIHGDGEAAVTAQGERADRLARRLVCEPRPGAAPATAEERDAFVRMYRRAAEQARTVGARVLHWSGTETGPEGEAARVLGARVTGEIARIWTVDPSGWWPPGGLPAVRVRTLPPPRVGLIGEGAELTVAVEDDRAYLNAGEAITAPGVGAAILGALVAELVESIRRTYPDVRELAVFEFDGDTEGAVRQALPLAGLRIEHRVWDFELALD